MFNLNFQIILQKKVKEKLW